MRHPAKLVTALALLLAPASARAADPSALWNIVGGQCVPDEQTAHDPAPCAAVDLAGGVAVLKDINGVAQFLLIPTVRISGIEDPAILAPDAVNYWAAAWQARSFVEARLHTTLPRDLVSLAINSSVGRTQNQLHIHVDCVRPDVHDFLTANLDKVSSAWSVFPVPLAGHIYRSMRINQDTLGGVDPFRVLADTDPGARADMGHQTIVVVGATFPDGTAGFVVLNDHADLTAGDFASGEQLQDHTCAVVPK